MFRSKLVLALLATGLVFGVTLEKAHAQAGIAGFNTSCKKDYRSWKKHKGWKAYAVSNIYLLRTTEWQSCGSSWEYSTKANAVSVALIECRSQLKRKHAPKSARCAATAVSR